MQPILNASLRCLSLAVLSTLFVGCGGGGDSSGGAVNNPAPTNNPSNVVPLVEEVLPPPIDVENNNVTAGGGNSNPTNDVVTNVNYINSEHQAVFERLNERRSTCGFGALEYSKNLGYAAQNHAKYLLYASEYSDEPFSGHGEYQNTDIINPYFTGEGLVDRINTDTSTKGSLAKDVVYDYKILDESLSYIRYPNRYLNYKNDVDIALDAINGLLSAPYHLASLVNPALTQVGISYGRGQTRLSNHQGSILEVVLGRPLSQPQFESTKVLSYPCDNIEGAAYKLDNETPDPFYGTGRSLKTNPIGQPIYILGNGAITVSNYRLANAANIEVPLIDLTASNDPHTRLDESEVILMPLNPLTPNHWYQVKYDVTVDNGSTMTKNFRFKTRAE